MMEAECRGSGSGPPPEQLHSSSNKDIFKLTFECICRITYYIGSLLYYDMQPFKTQTSCHHVHVICSGVEMEEMHKN